uniref:Uncharacterized protein n=1 Tax=Candidatus Kentrum sp. TC TaxID=2126339 RepID=A0A450YJT1_9GAMM|nr:MAG: hypothetical protein BECKTC1821D_GA0114238_100644 [Candidatus Kentron sp. TC]VFK41792.1 MAG: hypothetical protein BECKTC1821E_GA0114239_101430 [Candidatus Kentron sp. TC]VFK56435.1 MAG: hypothetical protein BECKTC1821F_GA0114240_101017 [Candidatus Kentron sp. TC]
MRDGGFVIRIEQYVDPFVSYSIISEQGRKIHDYSFAVIRLFPAQLHGIIFHHPTRDTREIS